MFSNAQRTPTKGQSRSGRSSTPRGDAPLTGRKPPVPRFGGGRPSGTCSPHPSSSRQYKGSSENIQVAVRVRAFLPREEGEDMVVRMKDKTCQLVMPNGEKKLFTYDNCFWSADQSTPESEFADQSYVYETIGSQLVDNAMRGFNSTIFAYGQTGSGKTYSLYGPDGSYNTDQEGLVPRVCKELFEQINHGQEGVTYKVQASMIEVYLENVYDLLNEKNRLLIRGSVDTGFYLPGVRKFDVNDYNAIQSLIKKGQAHRVTACTELNDQSSRAHTLFEVEVKQITADRTTTSKISLVDLAGSERVKDAKVEGIVLTQACHINKSLLNLGNCIEAIVERCKHPNKPISVPFRDSALTRLLKESLGGNARTILLVTISPSVESLAQTLAALRFADRAKQIKTHAVINEDALRQAKDLARMIQEQYKERLKHLNEEYQLEIKQAELKEKELELEREAARLLLERESLWSTTRTITELERRRLEERERELEKQYQAVLQTQQDTAAQREELNSQAAKINSEQEERKREKQHEEELRILLQEQLNQLREDHESLLSETERKEFEFREKITVLEQQVQALTQQLEEKEAQRKREESHYKLITQSEIERIKVLEEMKNKKLKHEHEELNRELRDEAVEVEARLRSRIDELLKKNVELADALSQSQAKIHQLQNEQEALKASSAETQSLALRLHREEVTAIREEYESKMTALQSQLESNYNKEVQTLHETHSMEMASLRVQLDNAFHETMQTARETHQAERNRISVELETSWRNLETYKREAQDRLEKCDEVWRAKLENVEEQHQIKLTEMRKQLESAQEAQVINTTHHNNELVQLRQEMEEQHTAQLRLSSQKHAEKVSELQQDMETHFHEQLKSEYKKHSLELTALRNEMELNAKTMLEDVTNKHNAQIASLKAEHEKRDEELTKQFEEKIETLNMSHTQQIQTSEQKYKEEIERKEISYQSQSSEWIKEREHLIQIHNTEKSQLNERLLQLEQMLCEKKMELVEKNEAHRSVAELIAKCSTILNGKQCGRTRSLNSSRLSDISNKENEYYDSPSSSFIEEKLSLQLLQSVE